VIVELAAVLSAKFAVPDATIAAEIERLLSWKPVPVDDRVISEGLCIREHYHLSYWDSWIIGAALHARCETIYWEDLQHLGQE
jgi:predicted nucleic acid-binding protein